MNTKKLWMTIKPLSPNESKNANTIILHLKQNNQRQQEDTTYFGQVLHEFEENSEIK